MSNKDRRSQTFVERTLVLLEEKFPWLGKNNDDQSAERILSMSWLTCIES